jgi:hypothetical protein
MTEDRTKFLEFITGLVDVDGETALMLRQKPTLIDGEVVYHGDGAPKATWPAFLPHKAMAKMKAGEAWYINTGSFIVDRFVDGKPAARAETCEYVLFMMLDDIGTKSKTPPIPPTWIMETSEGSFQWGYAFKDQPTKQEFTAAIKAIADAGYTDPGATNAVRNCRIPGSVNLKQGRKHFQARLVEFYPDREYLLDDICAALGVTPAEPDTAEHRRITIRDNGGDTVLRWLSDQGLVLSEVNHEGWCGVVCPNHGEHTDGALEGRYKPLDRAYHCYHGHCQHLDSRLFLDWVADNDGPRVVSGLRDDLIAERMRQMADKIAPTPSYPDDASAAIREVERKEAGRLERMDWFERFGYIQSDDSYFDMVTRREVARHVFNALYRHVDCRSIHNSKQRIPASFYYDERRQQYGARALAGVTYAAGEEVLVARDGLMYGNRWTNSRPDMSGAATVQESDISRWLDHCRHMVPDPVELNHIFDVMAYKVQHPNIKINHAVLHGGDEGTGKDTMWAPFLWAIGGMHQHNRSIIETKGLDSQWGYGLEAEVVILNELKEPEARERRALANKLKPIIAAPPETISINRKGLHPYEMLNRLQVIAFTNDPLPITIPTQDRRWFCVWSHGERMRPDAADAMWRGYRVGGYERIAAWLWQRDVSGFNPAAAPPVTEWKLNLVEHGLSVAESFLVDLMVKRVGPFASGVVAGPFHRLCDVVTSNHVPSGTKIPPAALLHALKEAKWLDMGRIGSTEHQTKKHIFASPDVAQRYNKSELRRMVEGVASVEGKVVK